MGEPQLRRPSRHPARPPRHGAGDGEPAGVLRVPDPRPGGGRGPRARPGSLAHGVLRERTRQRRQDRDRRAASGPCATARSSASSGSTTPTRPARQPAPTAGNASNFTFQARVAAVASAGVEQRPSWVAQATLPRTDTGVNAGLRTWVPGREVAVHFHCPKCQTSVNAAHLSGSNPVCPRCGAPATEPLSFFASLPSRYRRRERKRSSPVVRRKQAGPGPLFHR